jgi:hypothetical protein
MIDALAGFQAELVEDEVGRSEVVVRLGGGDQEIVNVLNAIERTPSPTPAQNQSWPRSK